MGGIRGRGTHAGEPTTTTISVVRCTCDKGRNITGEGEKGYRGRGKGA